VRADKIVRRVLGQVVTAIHQTRVNAVVAAVVALIQGGEVALSALGRSMGSRSQKHGIKRVDRLLGNSALMAELDAIYAAIARYAIRGQKQPVVLLDWTDTSKTTCTLSAAIPAQGRAITIYSVTCASSQYASRSVENAFLKKLGALLPTGCKPILVGDAGFRAPWMKQVLAMKWDFVVRVRGRTQVQCVGDKGWAHWKKLSSLAGRKPRSLGTYRFVRSNSVEAQLVVVDDRSKRARRPPKVKRRNLRASRAAKAHREPWFLATSLKFKPKRVVRIYATRMQIELTFRDLKSHRFGWGFEDARCRSMSRIAIQILLATLASLVTMLVGIAAEEAGIHRRYQANTITKRRVLSWVLLGRAVLNADDECLANLQLPNLQHHLPKL
jgi:hypothetical protein